MSTFLVKMGVSGSVLFFLRIFGNENERRVLIKQKETTYLKRGYFRFWKRFDTK